MERYCKPLKAEVKVEKVKCLSGLVYFGSSCRFCKCLFYVVSVAWTAVPCTKRIEPAVWSCIKYYAVPTAVEFIVVTVLKMHCRHKQNAVSLGFQMPNMAFCILILPAEFQKVTHEFKKMIKVPALWSPVLVKIIFHRLHYTQYRCVL